MSDTLKQVTLTAYCGTYIWSILQVAHLAKKAHLPWEIGSVFVMQLVDVFGNDIVTTPSGARMC